MAILLIQEEVITREKLAFSLEANFGETVIQVDNYASAASLPDADEINLIILDLGTDGSMIAAAGLDELQAVTLKVPFILCTDSRTTDVPKFKWKTIAVINRTEIIANVLKTLQHLAQTGKIQLGFQKDDYCSIKTKLLLSVYPLQSDIFIRLSENKYVKLFRQGDLFELADMEKYTVRKGVERLYIAKTAANEFIEKYNADLQKSIKKSQKLSLEDAAELHNSLYETVQELGTSIGFTSKVQMLAKTHVQLSIKFIEKSPKLSSLLSRIKSYKGEYIGAHSAIVGYLACAIAARLEWGSESTFQKLTLAAFLHDITLTDHKLARCNTLKEAAEAGFTPVQVAAYEDHPIHASQIAQHFQEIPPDVDVIILQHHERPDSTGFPRGIANAYIAPLAMVFMIAHEMAQYFLDHGGKLNVSNFLTEIRDRYNWIQFRKILEAVETLQDSAGDTVA